MTRDHIHELRELHAAAGELYTLLDAVEPLKALDTAVEVLVLAIEHDREEDAPGAGQDVRLSGRREAAEELEMIMGQSRQSMRQLVATWARVEALYDTVSAPVSLARAA